MVRKFIFLENIDSSNKKMKGHVQFNENKHISIKIFLEGLKSEEYSIDLILSDGSLKHIDCLYGHNKIEKSFDSHYMMKDIHAIVIYPLNGKEISLVGYLKNKEKINVNQIVFSNKKDTYSINKNLEKDIKKEVSQLDEARVKIDNNDTLVEEKIEGKSVEQEEMEEKLPDIDEERKEEIVYQYKETEIAEDNILKDDFKENKKNDTLRENTENGDNNSDELKGGVYNNQIFYLWENIEKLDTSLEEIEPFKQNIPNHKWWKVNEFNDEIHYFCILYNGYLMPMIYPFMNYKNVSVMERDWIFGTVVEEYGEKEILKYFVYGVPGRFYLQEQPFKGSTGYLYWQSIDHINDDPIGYWLLYVDVQTGKIVIPRRPLKAPLNKNITHKNM